MKQFKFLTKRKKNRQIVYASVKITILWGWITLLKRNFSCVNRKPSMGQRCWIAEKKNSAYLLDKRLSDELTREYYSE